MSTGHAESGVATIGPRSRAGAAYHHTVTVSHRGTIAPLRALAEQAFSRAAGASLVPGNSIRLLKDARENYPAWLDAIARASRSIHFESYIIHDDRLDGWIRQDFAPVLEPIACRWRRGPATRKRCTSRA
jgi:phosphatidylserine/phosphatidylglycerophosphate/cardiolipin synthase-like enzyme